ncbi:PREDICTED: uncharacterized protein LOC104600711 [Nelumbo nucifera]|uniref:Uncharacterized protein LOC104600711 n=1 Tax=Nelumbo nucifera TaxID=4432 RepID=A0A1U8AIX2_NELNU|nr:PREDICTED: uncharacterized protein LOC104600711 [Nelumbo nucifera]
MLEESVPSIWASMYSWFTPTVLFLLLNLMIGTIAVTSSLGSHKHDHNKDERHGHHPQLARAPSVLQRLKSINLYRYRSEEFNAFPTITTAYQPPETEVVQKIEPTEQHQQVQEEDEVVEEEEEEEKVGRAVHHNPDQVHDHHVSRSKSDTKPSSGDIPVKLPQKMKKSATTKSAFRHFEEEDIVERRRPSTVRENESKASDLQSVGVDEEVDAKADDFINRFKQQLKLQRLDSIMRYKEMLSRGAK